METNAYWHTNNYNLCSCQQAIVWENTGVTQELQCIFKYKDYYKDKIDFYAA